MISRPYLSNMSIGAAGASLCSIAVIIASIAGCSGGSGGPNAAKAVDPTKTLPAVDAHRKAAGWRASGGA